MEHGLVDAALDLVAHPRIERRSGAAALIGVWNTPEGRPIAPGAPERRTLASIEHVGHPCRDAAKVIRKQGMPTGLETSTNLHNYPVLRIPTYPHLSLCIPSCPPLSLPVDSCRPLLPFEDCPTRAWDQSANCGLLGFQLRAAGALIGWSGFSSNSISAARWRASVSGTCS